jgi:hypothetical protein
MCLISHWSRVLHDEYMMLDMYVVIGTLLDLSAHEASPVPSLPPFCPLGQLDPISHGSCNGISSHKFNLKMMDDGRYSHVVQGRKNWAAQVGVPPSTARDKTTKFVRFNSLSKPLISA